MPTEPLIQDAQVIPPPPFDLEKVQQVTQDFKILKHLLMALVLDRKAQVILEVGTDVGDSTRVFSSCLQMTGGKLYTIDKEVPKQNWLESWPLKNVTFILGDSITIPWGEPLDLLWLDGDHTVDHLTKELAYFGRQVKVGGRIALHDTCHNEFGQGITGVIRAFCQEQQLTWTEYPFQHGLAVIDVSHSVQ